MTVVPTKEEPLSVPFWLRAKVPPRGAEAFAQYEGKCPLCMRAIELEDHIIGVEIDGQGHEWDCRTT